MTAESDEGVIASRIETARSEAVAAIAALQRELAGMINSSEASNADDEHDPEGATIAFERAQVAALLEQAQARLSDLDHALLILARGEYGRCERCGAPISAERLAARPAARTCIGCARLASR